ncbi:E3 ubiquitin-protein ligase march7 [Lambiella insularis]|nr:E3 ubiquitin-protein ligase march7 [Lambiella insularis]
MAGMSSAVPEAGKAAEPDVMNDPSYDTNSKGKEKSLDEPDTCRICRAEGSVEEPLFYPCKCSGSIKFVHQNCLMEWLSHSQKKHCELCKTSFRFTKLYHPQMPSTVPLPIFFRQAALHTLRSFLTWARWHLVLFVWLGWVPWCMRTVWRGLFWIGDGGWIDWQELQRKSSEAAQTGSDDLSTFATTLAHNTSLINNSFMLGDATASEVISELSRKVWSSQWSPRPQTLNSSVFEPTIFRFAKRMLRGIFYPSSTTTSINSSVTLNSTAPIEASDRSTSLLSSLSFLRTMTRWPTVNNLVIDILEGQLITLLIVVAFVLVFLIREWVVQQQPAINMGEAFNAAVPAVEGQEAEPQGPEQQAHEAAGAEVEVAPLASPPEDNDNMLAHADNERGPRPLAEPRRVGQLAQGQEPLDDVQDPADHAGNMRRDSNTEGHVDASTDSSTLTVAARPRSLSDTGLFTSSQRPGMPTRDALACATEIQRTMEEHTRASGQDWPGINVFMDLWHRADGKPSEVLKIIREEGREEELGWIVLAMKRLETASSGGPFKDSDSVASDLLTDTNELPAGEQQSDVSTESWQVVENTTQIARSTSTSSQRDTKDRAFKGTAHQAGSLEFDYSDEALDRINSLLDELEQSGKESNPPEQLHDQEQWIPSGIESSSREIPTGTHEAGTAVVAAPNALHSRDVADVTANDTSELGTIAAGQQDPDQAQHERQSTHLESPIGSQEVAVKRESMLETVIEWLWGGTERTNARAEEAGEDDEHVVHDVEEEAPFVPIAQGQLVLHNGNNAEGVGQDPEVLRAAAEAGLDQNDAEAVEDGEDLEGVMELIGMQGPLAGLVQNGMFSAVLISFTVFFGIWIPYIAGKLLLVFLANPISLFVKLPLRWASNIADLVIDTSIFVAASAFYWVEASVHWLVTPLGWLIPLLATMNNNRFASATAWKIGSAAGERLIKMFESTSDSFAESDIPAFSIIAHESLRSAEYRLSNVTKSSLSLIKDITYAHCNETYSTSENWSDLGRVIITGLNGTLISTHQAIKHTVQIAPSLLKINPLRISLDIPERSRTLDYSLADWGTRDRIIAIFLGYLCFSVAGALYLRVRTLFQDRQDREQPQGVVADVLNQAGGVLKVILIIGIEMIVFPLYCGLLLDAALLPLFENASTVSRMRFTMNSPYTSMFIHWFVGTCYMFHFALFVSMCRKIMRSGVLYFIRDPDDPTFHPVRDVLERNVATQLRKIAFSALVYGALVIICLGTIVWGLAFALESIFPIHWSSNEPVLEFPVDLLVYNFVMPLAVKFFKPSKGLTRMYDWWFRKCARVLRLSHFLFGDQKADEEGHHVRRTWWSAIFRKQGDPASPVKDGVLVVAEDQKPDAYFRRDGRYVRAPASDQVRIPKDTETFVLVNEDGERADGQADKDEGLHGRQNKMFAKVYIPPFFRLRVGVFILLIWLFAATTGVGFTIIPLLFGRYVFAHLIPSHLRMNDIYAFSIGIYLLGSPLYLLIHYHTNLFNLLQNVSSILALSLPNLTTVRQLLSRAAHHALHALRLFYFYSALIILLPSLLALLMETYLVIPMHTYFSPNTPPHTIHFIQDWTLGVLYLRMAARFVLWYANARPAQALRSIVAAPRHSWLHPDIRLATRAVIFPATMVLLLALTIPLAIGWLANRTIFASKGELLAGIVYRYSYPVMAGLAIGLAGCVQLGRALRGWRGKVRDEVYLIGERLHNFGERKAVMGSASRVAASA